MKNNNKEDPVSDFENVVSFASTDALGVTYQWFDGCYYEGEEICMERNRYNL